MTVSLDETRRYRDASNVVHRSSDRNNLRDGNRITFCERYELGIGAYLPLELSPTQEHLTCIRCITLSLRMWSNA